NTMVLSRPMRRATHGAASCEAADSNPVQKKKAPTAASDMSKRWNNHSASNDCTISPPAKASTENNAASLATTPRDAPNGAGGMGNGSSGRGSRRYSNQI